MDNHNLARKEAAPVAVLSLRTVIPGYEPAFEEALHDFILKSLHAEGQLGVHVMRPDPVSGSREYGILRRFSSPEFRDSFYDSPLFKDWEVTVTPLTEGELRRQELSGLETWFTLPGYKAVIPPPRWKMALVTAVGVWPTSILVPWLLRPLIGNMSLPMQALFVAVGIVILLTWVVMPLLVKILNPWLQGMH